MIDMRSVVQKNAMCADSAGEYFGGPKVFAVCIETHDGRLCTQFFSRSQRMIPSGVRIPLAREKPQHLPSNWWSQGSPVLNLDTQIITGTPDSTPWRKLWGERGGIWRNLWGERGSWGIERFRKTFWPGAVLGRSFDRIQ